MIWHARNRAGRCAALDAVTRNRRNSSRNPFPPPSAEEDAEADAKAATKRATRSDPADRRARVKSGVTATQKAARKGRPPPPPEEERSAASSRSFRGCTAWDARHSSSTRATSRARRSESPAPVTAAAGAMGCGGRVSGGGGGVGIGKGRILNRGEGNGLKTLERNCACATPSHCTVGPVDAATRWSLWAGKVVSFMGSCWARWGSTVTYYLYIRLSVISSD